MKSFQIIINNSNIKISLLSIIVGICAGVLTTVYRFTLDKLGRLSNYLYSETSHNLYMLTILIPLLLLISFILVKLIKKYPAIQGSGIPQVEGQLRGYFFYNWFSVAWPKFVAGSLGILSGLALGREGPSIQIGSSMGQMVAERLKINENNTRILIASGASAGLSVAFNAPLSGVMFTLEEVFKYFSPMILLACMSSAIISDSISSAIIGSNSIFNFNIVTAINIKQYWILFILGIILGIVGVLYNKMLLLTQKYMDNLKHSFMKIVIGISITLFCGIIYPEVVGSGENIISKLSINTSIYLLLFILFVRFMLSIVSYSTGVAGGIFFPLLVLGALIGCIFANISIHVLNLDQSLFYNFIILSMAGTFTSIVRAPITGIILLVEMTGDFSHLLPLAIVSIVAYITADSMGSEPIYDSLLMKLLNDSKISQKKPEKTHIIEINEIVKFNSKADGRTIEQLSFPNQCNIISIYRLGHEIFPELTTCIMAGDYITFSINSYNEIDIKEKIYNLISDE